MTETLADDPAGIARAAALLRAGALVAFGTETVYGLGADATNSRAVAAVFEAKGRPRFNPLICHYPTADAAFADVRASPLAERLAAAFWPGPLTLVLPRQATCPVALLAGAGLDTLAVRVPGAPASLALLREAATPIAAPSANRSGRLSPTSVADVLAELGGRIAAVVDCGRCSVGIESTVLDLSGDRPTLLRPGGVTQEMVEAIAGPLSRDAVAPAAAPSRSFRAPGLLASHYAPRASVRLAATQLDQDEALLAFGPALAGAGVAFQLSATRDLAEAAGNLFAGLRALDAAVLHHGLVRIAAMAVPREGLGLAINDRLERAAAPRVGD